MMNQLSVPALAANQRIEDWAATAGLDSEKKKVDYLPLYIVEMMEREKLPS